MNKMQKVCVILLVFLMMVSFYSCSNGGSSEDSPAQEDAYAFDNRDVPVNSASYTNTADIKLYLKKQVEDAEEGTTVFEPLSSGTYVGTTYQSFGIMVSPNLPGERVFVTDGGGNGVEALLKENGYYEFDYELDDLAYKAYPLLIQVIYPEGFASKKKYILSAGKDYKAEKGNLVQQGLGIIIQEQLLDGLKAGIGDLFGKALNAEGSVTVTKFAPAANTSGDKNGIFTVNAKLPAEKLVSVITSDDGGEVAENCFAAVLSDMLATLPNWLEWILASVVGEVDLKADLILNDTDAETGERGLYIGLEDLDLGPLLNTVASSMLGDGISFPMPAVSFDLGEMLGGLAGDDSGEDDLLGSLLGDLNLEKLLFLDVFGLPEQTAAEYSIIGASLYAADKDQVTNDGAGDPLFPEVAMDESQGMLNLDKIMPSGAYNMGIALSQYNLNQVLGEIVNGLEITLPAASLPIPLAIPVLDPGNDQKVVISINPAGIGIDLAYQSDPDLARLDIMDMTLEYIENGNPMWQMSLDISLKLNILVTNNMLGEEGLFLVLVMTPMEEFSNAHVMKDNLGIGPFDHSDFVPVLFETVGEMMGLPPGGTIIFPLSLSDFGLNPGVVEEGGSIGEIKYDGEGNCFMNLVVDSIDTSGLGCFISTVGTF